MSESNPSTKRAVGPAPARQQQPAGPIDWWTLEVTDRRTGKSARVRLQRPCGLIGSHPRADIRLHDPEIIGRHALVHLVRDGVFFLALGNRAALHFQGSRVAGGWLSDRQAFETGAFRIAAIRQGGLSGSGDRSGLAGDAGQVPEEIAGFGITEDAESRADCSSSRVPARQFLTARLSQEEDRLLPVWLYPENIKPHCGPVRLERELTLVGFRRPCKLRFRDSTISAVHCLLVRTQTGLWVADLASDEGTYVRGHRVRTASLSDNEVLQLGRVTLRVLLHDPDAQRLWQEEPATPVPTQTLSVPIADPAGGSVAVAESGSDGALGDSLGDGAVAEPMSDDAGPAVAASPYAWLLARRRRRRTGTARA